MEIKTQFKIGQRVYYWQYCAVFEVERYGSFKWHLQKGKIRNIRIDIDSQDNTDVRYFVMGTYRLSYEIFISKAGATREKPRHKPGWDNS